jgi:hypothetical protein
MGKNIKRNCAHFTDILQTSKPKKQKGVAEGVWGEDQSVEDRHIYYNVWVAAGEDY